MKYTLLKISIAAIALGMAQSVHAAAGCPSCSAKAENTASTPHHAITASLSSETFAMVLPKYLKMQQALAADDLDGARAAAKVMLGALAGVDQQPLLIEAAHQVAGAADIRVAREAFLPLSEVMIASARKLAGGEAADLYYAHCPMAFSNKGAAWLQEEKPIANPYYGSMMLRCGTIQPLARK